MQTESHRWISRIVVVVPTMLVAFFLGKLNVPVLPRVVAAVGVGMILMFAVALWSRRRDKEG
jgi:hypothetical protein